MELKFLGRGSAFNVNEGNTSAYFFDDNNLFLIDCGETVFCEISKRNLLSDIDEINVLITHTHSDHIGSLGSLVLYAFFCLNKKVNIIIPTNATKLKENIEKTLKCFGCYENTFNFVDEKSFNNKCSQFVNIKFLKTNHVRNLDCYGILFNTANGVVYYSGDTNEPNNIEKIIKSGVQIDKLYIDTSSINNRDSGHLYIGELERIIPHSLKEKTYCMHFNNDRSISMAKELGFNVVECEFQKARKTKDLSL